MKQALDNDSALRADHREEHVTVLVRVPEHFVCETEHALADVAAALWKSLTPDSPPVLGNPPQLAGFPLLHSQGG